MKTEDVKPKKVITQTYDNPRIQAQQDERMIAGITTPTPTVRLLLPPEEADAITAEVDEYIRLKAAEKANSARLSELNNKFLKVLMGNGIPGDVGFTCDAGVVKFREQTKESLVEDELLKYITADQLAGCRKKGQPYTVLTVKPNTMYSPKE